MPSRLASRNQMRRWSSGEISSGMVLCCVYHVRAQLIQWSVMGLTGVGIWKLREPWFRMRGVAGNAEDL